jgi:hypothetical protein
MYSSDIIGSASNVGADEVLLSSVGTMANMCFGLQLLRLRKVRFGSIRRQTRFEPARTMQASFTAGTMNFQENP